MAETKKSLVERLFAQQGGALQRVPVSARTPAPGGGGTRARSICAHVAGAGHHDGAQSRGLFVSPLPAIWRRNTAIAGRASPACSTSTIRWCRSSSQCYLPLGGAGSRATGRPVARVLTIIPEMPCGGGAAVLAWIELRGDCRTARSVDEYGQEISEPGSDALSAPHGAVGVSAMSPNDDRQRPLIAEQAPIGSWLTVPGCLRVSRRTLWPGSTHLRYMSRSISGWPNGQRSSGRVC